MVIVWVGAKRYIATSFLWNYKLHNKSLILVLIPLDTCLCEPKILFYACDIIGQVIELFESFRQFKLFILLLLHGDNWQDWTLRRLQQLLKIHHFHWNDKNQASYLHLMVNMFSLIGLSLLINSHTTVCSNDLLFSSNCVRLIKCTYWIF